MMQAQCINMTDLHDPNITCTYGTVLHYTDGSTSGSPYDNIGIIDNGSYSKYSRHTIHTYTNEHDVNVPMLKTIPEGETTSIRLGNWDVNYEAESITFTYVVTTEHPLLLLKYASVMQNPTGHGENEQPRVKLEVRNESNEAIDPLCNFFDFIASPNLGWNTIPQEGGSLLWKDWTNIGVNLKDHIGERVKIRLTNYDCGQGAHYGYAYIHLSCVEQKIETVACGEDVYMEAPAGYEYQWYKSSNPSKIIGTDQHVIVRADGAEYTCECHQIGKPLCFFEVTQIASASPRYPISDFIINQRFGCADTLYLTNTSGISSNGVSKNIPIESCDSVVWVLDDGRQFTQYDISNIPIIFANTGFHTITQTAFLKKGNCHSTKTQTIYVHGTNDQHSSYHTAEICEGGHYYFNGTRLTKDSTYTFLIRTSYNCDSTVNLRLIVHPQYLETDTIYICDGETIDYHGQKIKSSGTYYANFKTIYGCDSIFKAIVYRKNSFYIEKDTTICKGEIFDFSGRLLQTSGIYWDSARTEFGCDSITKLTLHVDPTYLIPIYAEICHDQSFWFRGRELFAPGIYYDSLLTRLGCDSVYKIILNKAPIYLIQDTVTICEGSYYNFRGRNISEEGVYYDSLQTVSGCDSIYQLLLIVQPLSLHVIDTAICGGVYDFRGRPLTTSGVYYDTVKTYYGCDSVYQLNLTVHPTYLIKDYIEQCEGDFFEFRNKRITQEGVYYDSLLTKDGCDSIYMLVYNTTPSYLHETQDTICSNKTYNFRGKALTRPGIYYDSLQTVSGCDSLFKITLYHHNSYLFENEDTIVACSNNAFINGRKVTESGSYIDSLQTTCGCDSIYKYNIIVHPAYLFEDSARICEHEPYNFRGKLLTESGLYEDSLTTSLGCDSVYRLRLYVTQTIRDTLFDTICLGNTYSFGGMSLKMAGLYSDTIADPMGKQCYIHSLNLGTKAAPHITRLTIPQICADEQYYELQFHYYGSKPHTYSVYYDTEAQRKGFVNVIDAPFMDTALIPLPQYEGNDYLRPDVYNARVEVNNGFCSPDTCDYNFELLVKYPSWVIRQHWNDVVATLNDQYNGGYVFNSYEWEVNGRKLTTTNLGYSNLYMPELNFGDEVCVYLTRVGETYAIPSCPITIHDQSANMQSEYPVMVQPTYVSKKSPALNIYSEQNGVYEILDNRGRIVCPQTICDKGETQVHLSVDEGLYILRLYI